ncbi:MAG: DUF4013 domain-containing protein [Acidobacteriota bacterium]
MSVSGTTGLPPASPPMDFGRSFTFIFRDPRWLNKTLIGGLFYLAGFFLIGYVFILGYLAQLVRNVIAGVETPLPEWNDLGEFFKDGLKLMVVGFGYMLPIFLLTALIIIPAVLLESSNHGQFSGAFAGCAVVLIIPFSLVISVILPAAALRCIVLQNISAAFDLRAVFAFVRENAGNYLMAVVIYFVAGFLAQFGVLLLCVGVVFTAFLALVVAAHAFGQVWVAARTQ